MKRFALLAILSVVLALSLATMVIASPETWIPYRIAVQTDVMTALMVPEDPDIGVAIVNANETSVFSQVDVDSRSKIGSSLVIMVSPPTQAIFHSSTIMLRSVVLNDKQPMLAAQQQVSMVNHTQYANTEKNTGIDMMAVAEVSPNVTASSIHNGGFTAAFQRDLVVNGSIATLDAGSVVIIGNEVVAVYPQDLSKKMLKMQNTAADAKLAVFTGSAVTKAPVDVVSIKAHDIQANNFGFAIA